MVSRVMGALVIAGLIPALGACWYSEGAVLLQAGSAQPVETGPYRFHPQGEDPLAVELHSIPGGGYVYRSDNEVLSLFVHEAASGWYAVQFSGDGSSLPIAVAHVTDRRIDFYDPDCDDELGAIRGIEQDGSDCLVTTREGLLEAARLVAQRVERGEDVELNSWAEPDWAPAAPQ